MKKVYVYVFILKFFYVINFFDKLKNWNVFFIYLCIFILVVEVMKYVLFCCMLSIYSKKSLGFK